MLHSYRQEWQASGVATEIIDFNVLHLDSNAAYSYLLYSQDLPRRNDRRLTNQYLQKYRHIEHGGWWVSGLDPLNNWSESLWGQFKPNQPRTDSQGKPIKYETPPKTPTSIFCLRISLSLWHGISQRYGVPMPEEITITPEGEAVGFWAWVVSNPQLPLIITEGAKKAGCLLSNHFIAIALPGVFNGHRTPKDAFGEKVGQPHLIPELKVFTQKGRQFYLCFDSDHKHSTMRNVNIAISKLSDLLEKEGTKVKIISWKAPFKGVDDFISAAGIKAFESCYHSALPLNCWKSKQAFELTFPTLKVNQRWFTDALEGVSIPSNAKIIGFKSPKGTGKTEQFVHIAAEAIREGRPVLVLTHRKQLAIALAKRLGIPYVTELKDSPVGKTFGYALCIDSLHPQSQARFIADNWQDVTVIVDESEQVFWHLLNSQTCQKKGKRINIFQELRKLIQNVISSESGQIYLADADLSNLSINFIRSLSGYPVKPFIIENTWRPSRQDCWDIYHYEGTTPSGLVSALKKHIYTGQKAMLICSAQKAKSQWGTISMENYFRSEFPHLNILRIDSETISDPTHPAFRCTAHLDEVLPQYDLAIVSPCLDTGVSIDIRGHFDGVWAIAQGVQATNTVRQQLARIREPVERHLWVAKRGFNKVGNGGTTFQSLSAGEHKLAQLNFRLLSEFDLHNLHLNLDSEDKLVTVWAKFACRVNLGMADYQAILLAELKEEGHRIIRASALPDELVKKEVKQTCLNAQLEQAIKISLAREISRIEAEALADLQEKTSEQRHQERKYALEQRYCVPVTPGLVLKDNEGWYPQLLLHYYLTLGKEHLPQRDRAKAEALVNEENKVWKPDFNKSLLGAKVHVLEKLGILNLIGRTYTNSDPEVQQIAQIALANIWRIKTALGISIHKKLTPSIILRRLFAKLGIKTSTCGRVSTGKREWIHQALIPDDGRSDIFECWLRRDIHFAQASSSKVTGSEVSKSNGCNLELAETSAV